MEALFEAGVLSVFVLAILEIAGFVAAQFIRRNVFKVLRRRLAPLFAQDKASDAVNIGYRFVGVNFLAFEKLPSNAIEGFISAVFGHWATTRLEQLRESLMQTHVLIRSALFVWVEPRKKRAKFPTQECCLLRQHVSSRRRGRSN